MEPDNSRICGLDEAGRGALAGPLVAAAVVLPCPRAIISRCAGFPLRDGKLLTAQKRRRIYTVLKQLQTVIAVEVISCRSVNNHGIGWANREIFRRLIKRVPAEAYIVDGKLTVGRIYGKTNIRSVVDADATIPEVICAGIVAKVKRDAIMLELHHKHPDYGWETNAGYGTRSHILALQTHDMTIHHRRIYVATALRNRS